ncbi:MAG: hypothetical protein KDD64_13575, partial [Bdellovibrionales bacterium]|nr:hypothetical protein [Bdellovibrionales bacterium]
VMNLKQISVELSKRLVSLFKDGEKGGLPSYRRRHHDFYSRAENQGLHHFFEYFHGDTGEGLGACHQTGWTALVALCIEKMHRHEETP